MMPPGILLPVATAIALCVVLIACASPPAEKPSPRVGTQPGTQLRVRGKGLPEHAERFGDLYINVRVRTPEELADDERQLWEQLAKISRFNPRET